MNTSRIVSLLGILTLASLVIVTPVTAYSGSESGYYVKLVVPEEHKDTAPEANYRLTVLASTQTAGFLRTESGYNINLNLYPSGVGGGYNESGFRLYLVPEQAYISHWCEIPANDPLCIYASFPDADNDGISDAAEGTGDTDGDGTPDYKDPDDDGDGVPTAQENPDPNGNGDPSDAQDTDGDGTPDYKDPDDDGDGIPTADEDIDGNGDPTNDDTDGDGIPDYLDNDRGVPAFTPTGLVALVGLLGAIAVVTLVRKRR